MAIKYQASRLNGTGETPYSRMNTVTVCSPTNNQVKSMVEWLLAKCQFLYGDLDLKVSELFQ
jgi:hypothetical protein